MNVEPVFDAGDTMVRLGDDLELFTELVESFKLDAARGLSNIRRAVDERNVRSLADAAHTLKGLVSIFAAGPATRVALAIEQAARDGAFADAARLINDLEDSLRRLAVELESFTERVA